MEAELACGHAAQVLPTIEALCREHPLREAFRAQLMTAYYRAGRQADALAVFRAFHEELAGKLGVDPSPALVRLERRMLTQDPRLIGPRPARALRGYRLGDRLGSGRDGTVHAASLSGVDRELAIKVCGPRWRTPRVHPRVRGHADPGRFAAPPARADPRLVARARRRLRGHPPDARRDARDRLRRCPLAVVSSSPWSVASGARSGTRRPRPRARPAGRDNVFFEAAGEPVLTDFWLAAAGAAAADDVARSRALVGAALAGRERTPGLAARSRPPPRAMARSDRSAFWPRSELGSRRRPGRNPYKGLRAFDEADAADFFGRADLVDELLGPPRAATTSGRLVLVVGGSGTGKSSVVRAGLLPRLRRRSVAGLRGAGSSRRCCRALPVQGAGGGLRRVAVTDADGLAEELAEDARARPRVAPRAARRRSAAAGRRPVRGAVHAGARGRPAGVPRRRSCTR